MSIIKWTEIGLFHNIKTSANKYPELLNGKSAASYKSKVKLHGNNGGVQIFDDQVSAQSRTIELTSSNDKSGFARFVEERKEAFKNIRKNVILFGEWIGKGIQRNVAVSSIPQKSFAVFAARTLPIDENSKFIIEPNELSSLIGNIDSVYVLPWHSLDVTIDWLASDEDLQSVTETINAEVLQIEKSDPWTKDIFGIDGTGEGLVFYPISAEHAGYEHFSNLCFKAKGEKHSTIAAAQPAQVNPESAANAQKFAELVLTDSRLQQGAAAVASNSEKVFDVKLIGKFLTWIMTDVQKETVDELTASNLQFKDVQKSLNDLARKWYLEQVKANQ